MSMLQEAHVGLAIIGEHDDDDVDDNTDDNEDDDADPNEDDEVDDADDNEVVVDRTGRNGGSPGFRFCFHKVPLSQKSPSRSRALVSIIIVRVISSISYVH